MTSDLASTVTWRRTDDAPVLVVLVHEARAGSAAVNALVEQLPAELSYAVLAAPATGSPESDGSALLGLLDEVADDTKALVIAGHGEAAPAVGAAVLADPARFAGAAILNGALPFADDQDLPGAALTGLPVFHSQGEQDITVPQKAQTRTWDYLTSESGAPVVAYRDMGGHDLTPTTMAELAKWLTHRVEHLTTVGAAPVALTDPAQWPTLGGTLPDRRGGRPRVTWSVPQQQISDQAMVEFTDLLVEKLGDMAGVEVGESSFAVPGARSLHARDGNGADAAFLDAETREFAHLHPWYDGSVHLALPPEQAADAIARGWAQPHMWAGTRFCDGFMLVYGPRDEAEVDVVAGIIGASYAFATGS